MMRLHDLLADTQRWLVGAIVLSRLAFIPKSFEKCDKVVFRSESLRLHKVVQHDQEHGEALLKV
jgi:hypothetical protein